MNALYYNYYSVYCFLLVIQLFYWYRICCFVLKFLMIMKHFFVTYNKSNLFIVSHSSLFYERLAYSLLQTDNCALNYISYLRVMYYSKL